MLKEQNKILRVGDCLVHPKLNSVTRGGVEHHLESKVMLVLLALASHPNDVVSKEDLIAQVWPDTFVSDDVLTRCISILRRVAKDDPHAPHFIQTIPKVGYRLVASVSEKQIPAPAPSSESNSAPVAAADDFVSAEEEADPALARKSAEGPSLPEPLPAPKGWSKPVLLTILGMSLLLSFLGASWFWLARARSGSPQPASRWRVLQFTSSAGEQIQPAFSPDGKSLAFVLIPQNGGARRIYLKRIGSETLTRLVNSDDEQFSPAWSPDGRQIAYLSSSKDGLGIYIADVSGKHPPRKVYIPQEPSHWEQNALSWSPDGKSLIFPDHSGVQSNSSIYQLNVATGEVHSITSPPPGWEGDLNPAYSPDGKKIAFTRASETAVRDVYWLSLSDGRVHQLTHDKMDIDSLAWSLDSASIVFSSDRGGKYALWKKGLNQAEAERLPFGTEDAYQPAIGPKPGQLAYTQGAAIWNIVRIEPQNGRTADAPPSVVLSSTQQDSAPSLSPDGKYFAIQSVRSGSQEIWIASIDGDSLRQLTFMGGPMTGSPAWSHRGDKILFDSRPDGHSHIFVVPAAGGTPKQLTFGNDNDIIPRWSHDDQVIYFRSNRANRWQIWKIPAGGGDAQPVTSLDGIVPQESSDGKYLYYARGNEDGLWRIPVEGGPETRVMKEPPAAYWGYWSITSQGLFYLDRSDGRTSIRILDPETRRTSIFAILRHLPPPYAGISVADQGRFILMTDEDHNTGRHITLVEAQP